MHPCTATLLCSGGALLTSSSREMRPDTQLGLQQKSLARHTECRFEKVPQSWLMSFDGGSHHWASSLPSLTTPQRLSPVFLTLNNL